MPMPQKSNFADRRLHISKQSLAPERETILQLLSSLEMLQQQHGAARTIAEGYVHQMRRAGLHGGVESFLHEYGLETKEGIAIMCLAEALLRIPDTATVDALISGTFKHTE